MEQIIRDKLVELSRERNIKILYACESGSRAWGFPSTDSDYDVRFIYAHQKSEYLSISLPVDTIDLPVNELLDIGGWELRKTLQLYLKSNAPLYEWLQSPIVYFEQGNFADDLLALQDAYFSARAMAHHYFSMANNVWVAESGNTDMRLKKYFYVLRPLLAAKWTIDKLSCPPMELSLLRTEVTDSQWQDEVNRFLSIKATASEKDTIQRSAVLDSWIMDTFDYCRDKIMSTLVKQTDRKQLDVFFRKYLSDDF